MGLFNIFKKKQNIPQDERLIQDDLSNWILNKKKEQKLKEQEFFTPIKQRISQLISELKEEILVLENVDFEKKKVDSRIKLIVKENLKNYIWYLQKVINKLNEINNGKEIIDKTNQIFSEFNKRSKISYEKITFIVGKEMQATKDSIKKFFKDLENILKSNKEILEEFKVIGEIEKDNEKLLGINENKLKILKSLNEDVEKLKYLEKDFKLTSDQIYDLKKSDKFKQEEDKKKKLELKLKESEKLIEKLNLKIDFKYLSNFYHKFEKEMTLVKQYREQFKLTLKKLGIENLFELLKEAKQDKGEVLDLIQKIQEKEKEISEIILENIGAKDLEEEINKTQSEIKTIESEKEIKEKKIKNLDGELEEQLEKIKDKLEKLKIELN